MVLPFRAALFMPKAPQGRRWQHLGGPPSRLREVGRLTSVARQLVSTIMPWLMFVQSV